MLVSAVQCPGLVMGDSVNVGQSELNSHHFHPPAGVKTIPWNKIANQIFNSPCYALPIANTIKFTLELCVEALGPAHNSLGASRPIPHHSLPPSVCSRRLSSPQMGCCSASRGFALGSPSASSISSPLSSDQLLLFLLGSCSLGSHL